MVVKCVVPGGVDGAPPRVQPRGGVLVGHWPVASHTSTQVSRLYSRVASSVLDGLDWSHAVQYSDH